MYLPKLRSAAARWTPPGTLRVRRASVLGLVFGLLLGASGTAQRLAAGPGPAFAAGAESAAAGTAAVVSPEAMLPALSAEQIAAHMQHYIEWRAEALHSYESRRVMVLAYKGSLIDKQASETVQMTYTAPSSKQFVILSAMGSPLLRDSVFQRAMDSEQQAATRGDTHVTPANYDMQLLGRDRLPEGDCYVLAVTPRHNNRFTFRGKIWVQGTDFAVVRIEAQPVEAPSFWVKNGEFRTEYSKVGDFWFPARTVSSSHIRMGGDATLTIQYGPYHILSATPLQAQAASIVAPVQTAGR